MYCYKHYTNKIELNWVGMGWHQEQDTPPSFLPFIQMAHSESQETVRDCCGSLKPSKGRRHELGFSWFRAADWLSHLSVLWVPCARRAVERAAPCWCHPNEQMLSCSWLLGILGRVCWLNGGPVWGEPKASAPHHAPVSLGLFWLSCGPPGELATN